MKSPFLSVLRWVTIAILILLIAPAGRTKADPATLLFEDDFNGGIPGWTAVQPAGGAYLDGPMLWEYDKNSDSFAEHSNLYTDSANFSSSRIASMLINDTVAPSNFTYTVRLTTGDNDGFGLIWGFENEAVFYRVTFAQQNRALAGWPFQGVIVDRMNNGQITDLLGPDSTTFVPTIGQPFDVSIAVTNGLLTLTIVDNPLVAPVTNYFGTDVSPVVLPTAPSARVGMFSWGMAGGAPRPFRIQNPVLAPTPITGDPAATVLTNWSFLITPRGSDGTVPFVAQAPIWAYGININGNRGTMIENSDWTVDNTAPFTTNFAAPSAVAGDVNWSNYVYSARFILNDDDGWGMLLRYQNETNFYRIAFRNQNSQLGIKQGLTVQKNVNLVFDQIYSNAIAGFIPPIGQAFEVHAFIRTNRLQIIAIKNPDAATATTVASAPIDFDITPGGLANGKIGIFSWAMYNGTVTTDAGTEVDWVKVQQVNGEGLIVSSAFGTPNPPNGLSDFPISQVITASVDGIVITAPGVRQVPAGWTGLGSVPAVGATNQVVFTLSTFSSLTWKWQTQYLLTTNTTVGGTVTATLGPWVGATSNVTVTATASPGYVFTAWTGDTLSTRANLTFPMLRPVNLTANFAVDSDGDSLPDSWELQYFGNLGQDGTGDQSDLDGVVNSTEYLLGTNPNFAEALTVSDGLSSQWTNTSRDPGLPGELTVVDFGSGYRGAFGDNNEFRYADDFAFMPANNYADFASFQTERMIVRSNLWTPSWATNFSASWELSVGDNDGNCFYFRYNNESNWFRVTLVGEDPLAALIRPTLGVSVQRRTNGFHSVVPLTYVSGQQFAAYTDPTDGAGNPAGFKKVRVTVNATNQNFEVRVLAWNAFLGTPDFDPTYDLIHTFTDANLPSGRIGFGRWGQGGFGANANQVNGIPIPNGAFMDNIVVKSPADGAVVFSENFETAALGTNQFPAGWTNPYPVGSALESAWRVNVDGAISQLGNQGLLTTGTTLAPKADADGPILLAPNQMSANYALQIGFHQFDNDGVGFVYDFQDTNNYSRVIFRQELTFNTDIPPGLSVSRKSGGVWTDIVAGDPAFFYTPGRPFAVEFANNNGDYTLLARDLDNPAIISTWHWTGPAATANNRFGVTTWASQSAHVLYARAYNLPALAPAVPFKITNISLSGGNVILDISKPSGSSYHVLRATSVVGPYLTNAANQTATQYVEPAPVGSPYFYRLQLLP